MVIFMTMLACVQEEERVHQQPELSCGCATADQLSHFKEHRQMAAPGSFSPCLVRNFLEKTLTEMKLPLFSSFVVVKLKQKAN